MTSDSAHHRWLTAFAALTAMATLALITIGGLVTSHGAGMAVPDWPNSYGYNMFLFPISNWIGGIFYEHTHRLVATIVGVLVVALTRWLGGKAARLPLISIGILEIIMGLMLPRISANLKPAGYFLSGIGGVVLLAGLAWFRNAAAARPLPLLGWVAFVAVQVQGLLGGLRVVLMWDSIGIFHAALAQLFFVLLCAVVMLNTNWWRKQIELPVANRLLPALAWATVALIFGQLLLGATMRHQHAGLSIPDFPLAYGKLWPAMDPASVQSYNARRAEIASANPITAFQIELQMIHRIVAVLILTGVTFLAVAAKRTPFKTGGYIWLALVLTQALLGASTIWSNKAADVATAHVVVGALCLANGALLSIVVSRNLVCVRSSAPALATDLPLEPSRASG
jgi:heme a synthase